VESGTPVVEICRKLWVTEQTFYRWKKQFGDLGTPEVRERRQLRDENRKVKQLVADLSLDMNRPGFSETVLLEYRLGEFRACGVILGFKLCWRQVAQRFHQTHSVVPADPLQRGVFHKTMLQESLKKNSEPSVSSPK
jgi:hypothetical protein